MRRRVGVMAAMVCAAALCAQGARADSGSLRWNAPSGCPDSTWVEARIAKHLGRAIRGSEHAHVTVKKSDAGFHMTVRTRTPGGSGQVSHEHSDCSVLADLGALIIAMAIDPNAGATAPNPSPPRNIQHRDTENPGETRFATSPRTADTRLTTAGRRPVREITMWGRGFIAADRGGMPGVAGGFGAAVAAVRSPWRLEASMAYWPARRATLEEMPQAGGEVTLFIGAIRSCFRLLRIGGDWALCGLVEVGDISASSFGVSQPGSGRFVWLALGGAATFTIPVSNFVYFQIGIQGTGNLRRPKFTLPAGPVHQPDAVGARISGGLELRFR